MPHLHLEQLAAVAVAANLLASLSCIRERDEEGRKDGKRARSSSYKRRRRVEVKESRVEQSGRKERREQFHFGLAKVALIVPTAARNPSCVYVCL